MAISNRKQTSPENPCWIIGSSLSHHHHPPPAIFTPSSQPRRGEMATGSGSRPSLASDYAPTPDDYVQDSDSAFYAPLPLYRDENAGHDLRICEGDTVPMGCRCRELNSSCWPDDEHCVCPGKVAPNSIAPCNHTRCPVCSADPRLCAVRIGCECRKRAMSGDIFVCNARCHAGNGPGCGVKV